MIEYSREFVCLSICLNFAKAAKMLNISQPSLSRHMAELEKQLGFKLFERNPLALTAAGKYYLESISDIVAQLDAVVEHGQRIANGSSGSLTISMVPFDIGVYSNVIYESIAEMRAGTPGFLSQFFCSRSYTVYESILSGKADVGVVFDIPEELPDGIVCDWLMDYPCMVWAHKDNPILQQQSPRMENFAHCKLVSTNNKIFSAWFDAEVAVLRALNIESESRMKDIENAADFFVTLQPDEIKITSVVGITCPYNSSVVGVRFPDQSITFPSYLLHRTCSDESTVAKFAQICSQVAKRYMEETQSYSFASQL